MDKISLKSTKEYTIKFFLTTIIEDKLGFILFISRTIQNELKFSMFLTFFIYF